MKHFLLYFAMGLFSSFSLSAQNSLNFDGVNDNVTIAGGGGLNDLESGTIEMWVKWIGNSQDVGYGSLYGAVLGRQYNNHFNNQIIALNAQNPENAKIVWCPYVNSQRSLVSVSSPGSDTWVHIAIVYESGSHTMYVDGVQEATSSTTGDMEDNGSVPLSIGAWIDHGACFSRSEIDEVRIWNVKRSLEEINASKDVELTGNESGLVSYYRFNQGTAGGNNEGINTLTDETSNGNNGILNNFALTGESSNWVGGVGFTTLDVPIFNEINLSLHPNPANEFFRVAGITGREHYTIYDLGGRALLNGIIPDSKVVDIKQIPQGIYLLQLENRTPVKFMKK